MRNSDCWKLKINFDINQLFSSHVGNNEIGSYSRYKKMKAKTKVTTVLIIGLRNCEEILKYKTRKHHIIILGSESLVKWLNNVYYLQEDGDEEAPPPPIASRPGIHN